MNAPFRFSSALCVLSLLLPAQEPPPDVKGSGEARVNPDLPGAGLSQKEAEGMVDGENFENPKNSKPRFRGAQGFCRFVTVVSPEPVPPGGSGVMTVTMILQGDAVLTAPPPARFEEREGLGPFELGSPSFHPAKTGYLSAAFRGQEVYDNFATFEVPFSVKPNTSMGTFRMGLEMEFELHDGTTGAPIETFRQWVGESVEVGIPEPEPVIPPAAGAASGTGQVQPVPDPARSEADASMAAGPGDAVPPRPVEEGPARMGAVVGSEAESGDGEPLAPTSGSAGDLDLAAPDGSDLPWLLGGLAGGLLLLGLVLLRRK